jgi:hypothetical protein|tara:strand:+ start:618 stop:764 length:147 start_codon:yes stop_codon:yes gene_type:complete
MKVIARPKKEKEILASVKKSAKAEEIRKSIVAKAECCVDHLCGCNCGC